MACAEKDVAEERLVLAEHGGLGDVSLCGCGTVHLSIASLTLRMAPEAFGQLLRMCQKAAERLAVEALMQSSDDASVLMH